MEKYNRELAEAQFRATPKRVLIASSMAFLLGIVMSLRVLLLGSAPMSKSLWFAGLMFFNFAFSGMSLVRGSRISYALLVPFAALPLLGSFAYSVRLLRLLLTGEWLTDPVGVITGLFGISLLAIIIYLFRNLFSKEVLSYVWKQAPPVGPAVAEAQN